MQFTPQKNAWPSGTLQVKGGPQPKLQPNVSADIISKVPGSYTVKVLNDNPNAAISYSVTLATNRQLVWHVVRGFLTMPTPIAT